MPQNIGILAIEIYFPRTYVDQEDLEKYDGVSPGKYTIGLGQKGMAACGDREDIHSICMTVVSKLMEKQNKPYTAIGRLEVGTETMVDKSKSVKTVIMQLFRDHGHDGEIEGIDTVNACYGGTNALFNAVDWVESSAWDGRLALVVAADIAVYAAGGARATGGAGAIAMLIGPDAPLVLESRLRTSHMEHTYDFYKPMCDHSEYPMLDGALTLSCYLRALDRCYQRYLRNLMLHAQDPEQKQQLKASSTIDYFVFHSPFAKMVQKAFARVYLADLICLNEGNEESHDHLGEAPAGLDFVRNQNMTLDNSCPLNKELEKAMVKASQDKFASLVEPSLLASRLLGNCYCASLYIGLTSLLTVLTSKEEPLLIGKRVVLFSYGSGLAASMFSMKIVGSIESLVRSVDLISRLRDRLLLTPAEYNVFMEQRERLNAAGRNYKPSGDIRMLYPSTYYLEEIDNYYHRIYKYYPSVSNE